jgi:hypothetical protein
MMVPLAVIPGDTLGTMTRAKEVTALTHQNTGVGRRPIERVPRVPPSPASSHIVQLIVMRSRKSKSHFSYAACVLKLDENEPRLFIRMPSGVRCVKLRRRSEAG